MKLRPCEIIDRLFVYGFVGLLLAFFVDFPLLAVATGFASAFAFYYVEEKVYPRIGAAGPRAIFYRVALTWLVGHAVGWVTIGVPLLLTTDSQHLTNFELLRSTLLWGGALGMGVGAIGTVFSSFQRLAAKNEEQQRLLAENAKQAAELRELVARAETAALRAQINPHFLFNALNTLAYLTEEDPAAARRVVEKLARIFRRTLERSSETMTSLGEELEFVADYLGIECERFDDVLRIDKQIEPSSLVARIPTMLIQPLAENAVKHGICPVAQGGTLTLRTSIQINEDGAPRLMIELLDDGRGMDDARLTALLDGSTGVGLANVRDRLRLQYGQRASMTVTSVLGEGTHVTLDLPFEASPEALDAASAVAVAKTERSHVQV